jgi:hypothetical protein
MSVFPKKKNFITEIFSVSKPIIGMIHLDPLPGAPHFKGGNLKSVVDKALKEVGIYEKAGVDGLIVENAWDLPFPKPEDIGPETVAGMTYLTTYIKQKSKLPIGINILANAAIPGLAVAKSTNSSFVRVNQWVNAYVANEGIIEGASAKALRYRSSIKGDEIKIFADVHVKHGSHSIVQDRSVAEQTRDAEFFDADVLIATGQRTGDETNLDEIREIKNNTNLPVIIGSGLNINNAKDILSISDGAIVGSSLKENGNWWEPVSLEKVKKLMSKVKEIRKL